MHCLWNGEYGEHDLTFAPALETTLRIQEEQYQQYVGCVVGDYTCDKVEYDWGRRDQRWTCHCNLCGKVIYQYHTKDWRRGKGRKLTCECQIIREIQKREAEKRERVTINERKRLNNENEYVGKVYHGWVITRFSSANLCNVKCVVCGKELKEKRSLSKVISGEYPTCRHPTDYSGNEWIGKKIGHLTVIGREGKNFIYKCDCGKERISSPSLAFRVKAITNCGNPDCPYMDKAKRDCARRKDVGEQYEKDIYSRLIMQGYNAKIIGHTGDYGVDIIIDDESGDKIAVQCKMHKSIIGVDAIQEVYAGGRFYDCTKFAVVSDSGFSNNAIIMAKKLGVYLSNGNFEYPSDIQKYCSKLLPVYHENENNKRYYEIDGEKHTLGDWCAIYGNTIYKVKQNMKNGMSLKYALQTKKKSETRHNVNGVVGTKSELCKRFGVSEQLLRSRMNKGMTFEQAITQPKKIGRPKKVII